MCWIPCNALLPVHIHASHDPRSALQPSARLLGKYI